MIYIFFIIVCAAIWHFCWESIVAPSLRAQLRFQLFVVRDRLRDCRRTELIDYDLFETLESSINTSVLAVKGVSISDIVMFRNRFSQDDQLRKGLEKKIQWIQKNEVSVDMFNSITLIVSKAFLVNSGGWIALIIPALLIFVPISALCSIVEKLIALPENDATSMISSYPNVATG